MIWTWCLDITSTPDVQLFAEWSRLWQSLLILHQMSSLQLLSSILYNSSVPVSRLSTDPSSSCLFPNILLCNISCGNPLRHNMSLSIHCVYDTMLSLSLLEKFPHLFSYSPIWFSPSQDPNFNSFQFSLNSFVCMHLQYWMLQRYLDLKRFSSFVSGVFCGEDMLGGNSVKCTRKFTARIFKCWRKFKNKLGTWRRWCVVDI